MIRIRLRGIQILFYPAALPLSRQALPPGSFVATVGGSAHAGASLTPVARLRWCWPTCLLGDTFAELAAAFGISTATAWRYVIETVALLAARAPKPHQALAKATGAGHAYLVIDGTLISPSTGAPRTARSTPASSSACSTQASVMPSFHRWWIQAMNGSGLVSRLVGLDQQLAYVGFAGEPLHGRAVQAERPADRAEGVPGRQQLVHGGVAFPGLGDQAALASTHPAARPARPVARAGRLGRAARRRRRALREYPGLVFEAAAVGDDRLLGVSGQVVPQVPAVGELTVPSCCGAFGDPVPEELPQPVTTATRNGSAANFVIMVNKTLKRQMYGRASFELLRTLVILRPT